MSIILIYEYGLDSNIRSYWNMFHNDEFQMNCHMESTVPFILYLFLYLPRGYIPYEGALGHAQYYIGQTKNI